MTPVFLTPAAGLVAVAAVLPVAAALLRERRLRTVRALLRLDAPRRLDAFASAAAAAAGVVLLGLAAAQPAIARDGGLRERPDAEAYAVIDNSRSMLAVPARGGATRLARAKALALRLRDAVPEVPWGVASLNDRTLVQAFPTPSRSLFADTLAQSLGIRRPPPNWKERNATALDALGQTATYGYFDPAAAKRVVVLFTDGESRPFNTRVLARALRAGNVRAVVVRLWSRGDRVFDRRGRDLGYRPTSSGDARLEALAADGIATVPAARFAALPGIVERLVGDGPSVVAGRDRRLFPLAPLLVVAAVFPLGFALARGRA